MKNTAIKLGEQKMTKEQINKAINKIVNKILFYMLFFLLGIAGIMNYFDTLISPFILLCMGVSFCMMMTINSIKEVLLSLCVDEKKAD